MKQTCKKHITLSDALFYLCIVALALFLISALPNDEDMAIYDSVIRLHVLANSDSDEDQALKLEIRDAILEEFGETLASYDSVDDASEKLSSLIEEIEAFAKEEIVARGYEYDASVTLSREDYPTRVYENDISLPAGNYRSLRVIIGEGEGANWWCVLFPPLCLSASFGENLDSDESIPVGLTYEQYKLISGSDDPQYVLKFKLLELIGSR